MKEFRLLVVVLFVIRGTVSWPTPEDKVVDLSYAFDEDTIGWIYDKKFELVVTQKGISKQGYWLQEEEYSSGTHVGTHMDAPCHMVRGAWTIDQIPVSRFVGPAAVIDITSRANQDRDAVLLVTDLQIWEQNTGRTLDDTILLVRTGWGSRWPDREAYLGNANNDVNNLHFPGISPEAARWLALNRRIYGVGLDTLSLESGSNIRFGVAAHLALLGANVYGLENVANLDLLPSYGATLLVSPMKIRNACGGPVRILALLP